MLLITINQLTRYLYDIAMCQQENFLNLKVHLVQEIFDPMQI